MKMKKLIIGASVVTLSCGLMITGCTNKEESKTEEQVQSQKKETEKKLPRVLVHKNGNQVRITANGNATLLEFCQNNILKVNYLPDKLKGTSPGVVGRSSWTAVPYEIEDEKAQPLVMKTDTMRIEYDAYESGIKIYDKKDNLVLSQESIGKEYKDEVSFTYQGEQNFYGIHGYKADESSKELLLRNKGGRVEAGMQGDSGAPLIWNEKGYGLLFDSNGGAFKLNEGTIRFHDNSKKDIEYYFILGEPKEILKGVAEISGKPPMFPQWAMGFTNSEWGMDQKELEDIVKTYREKDFPLDNYTLDFDWKAWGEDNYGEFRWNETKFPDGPSGKLAKDMLDQGVKITGIMKPRILTGTVQGDYAKKHGFFYPNKEDYREYFSKKLSNDIDFSSAVARSWYFDHAKEALDTGLVGWWNDEADELGNNLQHMNMQMALYQGQRGYNSQRVWSINRNFYLGAQRYAYALWSGDIQSGFRSMQSQRERMLSNVMLGQMKWGMDTGGFNGANPTPENYTRWMQFSAFTPVFRVHSRLDQQRQPWLYGEVAEEAVRDVMKLRYSLLPYVYSYERQAYDTGLGLIKPLVLDYPEDKNVVNMVDAWMFGDHLLVAPVLDKGQKVKEIYLPEGRWIDYFRGNVYEGGTTLKYEVNSETWEDVPLFIKDGAILPTIEDMDYIGQKEITEVKLDIYPSEKESHFDYYEDDGATYKYEDGEYYKQRITAKVTSGDSKVVSLNFGDAEGVYNPVVKNFVIRVHVADTENKKIFVNGTELSQVQVTEDAYGSVMTFSVKAIEVKDIEIR